MIKIEWKDKNGKWHYDILLTDLFLKDKLKELKKNGCTDIAVTKIKPCD